MNIDFFKDDPLYNESLKYWIDSWSKTIKKIERKEIGIEIINIRIVLSDIINEYELNKFESENNRLVYIKLIDSLFKKNHIGLYRNELKILKEKLNNKEKKTAYIIAKGIFQKIEKVDFSQSLFDELKSYLIKNSYSNKDKLEIESLTKDIIIDLVTSGRSIKDLKDLIHDVFETYLVVPSEISEIESNNETKSNFKVLHFFKFLPENVSDDQAQNYIDNLTIENRLGIFRAALASTKNIYKFTFPVWGLKTSSFEINKKENILGFHIYDVDLTKARNGIDNDDSFYFLQTPNYKDDRNIMSLCNATITLESNFFSTAKRIAEEKLNILLRFLNLNFSNKRNEFFWDGQYVGNLIEGKDLIHHEKNEGMYDHTLLRKNISISNPIYLEKKDFSEIISFSKIINNLEKRNMQIELNSIINALELLSKSIWETDENKLLNYWICIENLSNISKLDTEKTFTFIKDTIPTLYYLNELYEPLISLFLLSHRYLHHKNEDVSIPKEFADLTSLNKVNDPESNISLKFFYDEMDKLKSYTTNKDFLEYINETLDFYKSNQKMREKLKDKKEEVELTINYIYKSRNQIVHNGYVDKSLIPYLVNFAERYATFLFKTIVFEYSIDNFDLQSYFVIQKYQGALLEKRFSEKALVKPKFKE